MSSMAALGIAKCHHALTAARVCFCLFCLLTVGRLLNLENVHKILQACPQVSSGWRRKVTARWLLKAASSDSCVCLKGLAQNGYLNYFKVFLGVRLSRWLVMSLFSVQAVRPSQYSSSRSI